MTEERTFIDQYSHSLWNKKDLSQVETCFSKDCTIHTSMGTLVGSKPMTEFVKTWLTAFPDLVVNFEEYVFEGDLVVSRWTAKGTHKGAFKGLEATGCTVDYAGTTIYRVKDNQIVEYWAFVNVHDIVETIKACEVACC